MSDSVRPPYYPAGSGGPDTPPGAAEASGLPAASQAPGGQLALAEARERAVRVLSDAYAYDVITEQEFERRLDRLPALDSAAAIDTLLSDLRQPREMVPASAYSPSAEAPVRLRATMTSTRRDGYWTVPQRLEVRAFMSDVNIDLRLATVPYGCVIDIRSMMSSVTITLPPGLAVTFEADGFMSSLENGTSHAIQTAPSASIRVTGRLVMSSLEAKVRSVF